MPLNMQQTVGEAEGATAYASGINQESIDNRFSGNGQDNGLCIEHVDRDMANPQQIRSQFVRKSSLSLL